MSPIPSGSRRRQVQADLALLGVAFIWGITFTLVKEALEDGPPWLFLTLRFLTAALILVPFAARAERPPWKAGSLLGLVLAAGYVTQTLGLRLIEPGRSAFLTGLGVILVPLLGGLLRWDRITRWDAGGALLAWAGLVTLTGWTGHPGNEVVVGDLWTLGCAFAFAVHILLVGHLSQRHPTLPLTGIQIATSLVLLAAGTVLFEPEVLRPSPGAPAGRPGFLEVSERFLLAAVVTGVLATAVAFIIQVRMQRETTATHTAIIFSMEPVFAALSSIVIRHEPVGWRELAGAVLILSGILAVQLGRTGGRERSRFPPGLGHSSGGSCL